MVKQPSITSKSSGMVSTFGPSESVTKISEDFTELMHGFWRSVCN